MRPADHPAATPNGDPPPRSASPGSVRGYDRTCHAITGVRTVTDDRIDPREPSSSPSSSPLAAAGPGASSRPAGTARRITGPATGTRRFALLLAAGAAIGTLGVAAGVAALGSPAPMPADTASAAAVVAATPAPTEQVIVDTVYVRDPAPTANPEPIVVPAPAAPAEQAPVVRVVRVVAGGEHEGGDEHEGAEGSGRSAESGEDD